MRGWIGPALAVVGVLALGRVDGALAASVRVDDVSGASGETVKVGLFLSEVSVVAPPDQQFFFQIPLDFDTTKLKLMAVALVPEGQSTPVDTAADTGFILPILNKTGASPMIEVTGVTGQSLAFVDSKLVDLTFMLQQAGTFAVGATLTTADVSPQGTTTVIPLPAAAWLFFGALASLSIFRRRRIS